MRLSQIIAQRHKLAQAAKCHSFEWAATRPQPCYARVPAWLKEITHA